MTTTIGYRPWASGRASYAGIMVPPEENWMSRAVMPLLSVLIAWASTMPGVRTPPTVVKAPNLSTSLRLSGLAMACLLLIGANSRGRTPVPAAQLRVSGVAPRARALGGSLCGGTKSRRHRCLPPAVFATGPAAGSGHHEHFGVHAPDVLAHVGDLRIEVQAVPRLEQDFLVPELEQDLALQHQRELLALVRGQHVGSVLDREGEHEGVHALAWPGDRQRLIRVAGRGHRLRRSSLACAHQGVVLGCSRAGRVLEELAQVDTHRTGDEDQVRDRRGDAAALEPREQRLGEAGLLAEPAQGEAPSLARLAQARCHRLHELPGFQAFVQDNLRLLEKKPFANAPCQAPRIGLTLFTHLLLLRRKHARPTRRFPHARHTSPVPRCGRPAARAGGGSRYGPGADQGRGHQ